MYRRTGTFGPGVALTLLPEKTYTMPEAGVLFKRAQMFPRLPARATFVADTKTVSDFV